jgi:glutathione peroxidase
MATSKESPFYNFKVLDCKYSPSPNVLLYVHLSFPRLRPAGNEEEYPLSSTKGKVVLVVNTASKCNFTPQYQGLEDIYRRLREKYDEDFVILGFPCNQFLRQEPGSNNDIQSFCQLSYGVTFPVLAKINVNGGQAAPLYRWLKQQKRGSLGRQRITWNFTKV